MNSTNDPALNVPSPDRPRPHRILRHRRAEIGERAFHRLDRRPEHLLAVLASPVVGADDGIEGGLEYGHDVTSEQLVTAHGLFPVRPFMRAEQYATETTLAVAQQPVDPLDHRLRRTDQRRAHFDTLAQR